MSALESISEVVCARISALNAAENARTVRTFDIIDRMKKGEIFDIEIVESDFKIPFRTVSK